jgi:hypothetical protein
MRLTWKKQANETGLARVSQGPRGYDLRYKGVAVGHVHYGRCPNGWYWWAACDTYGIALFNSAAKGIPPYTDIEDAKAACKKYVTEALQRVQ